MAPSSEGSSCPSPLRDLSGSGLLLCALTRVCACMRVCVRACIYQR